MPNTLPFCALMVLLCGCAGSQEMPAEYHADLGVRFVDSRKASDFLAEHSFEITNPYDKPLHLALKTRSCGCADYELERDLIVPGRSTTLTLSYNLSNSVQYRNEWVAFTTGRSDQPEVTFFLNVQTLPLVLIEPQVSTAAFTHESCEPITVTVFAYFPEDQTDLYVKLTSNNPFLQITEKGTVVQTRHDGIQKAVCTYSVSLSTEGQLTSIEQESLITAKTIASEYSALIRYLPTHSLRVEPERVFLSGTESRKIVVRGKQHFRLMKVTATGQALQIGDDADASSAMEHTITVSSDTEADGTKRVGELMIETDLESEPTLIVPIYKLQ